MSERHSNIFNAQEAAEYMHLESAATLDHLRREKVLAGYMIGKQMMYWREDLDDCAAKMFGRAVPPRMPTMTPMRMVGGQ